MIVHCSAKRVWAASVVFRTEALLETAAAQQRHPAEHHRPDHDDGYDDAHDDSGRH